ncbi:MAG: HD domain-containing protein [Armatimonadota bacterium]
MTQIIKELEQIVRGRLECWPAQWEGYHWPGYTWEHTLRVRNLALQLCRQAGADARIVEPAAILHDIDKPAGREHAHVGAKTARALLAERALPDELCARIVHAIDSHAGENTPEHPIENLVLGDADLIDANFGLVGTWRFITIRAGHGSTVEETVEGFSGWLPRKDELLELLNTDEGRAVAADRREWMHQFCSAAQEALADGTVGRGLLALIEHINAHHARGSIIEQLPELRRIAEATNDGALSACRRLEAEVEGRV